MKHACYWLCLAILLFLPPGQAQETATGVSAQVITAVVTKRNVASTVQAYGQVAPLPARIVSVAAPRASVVQLEVVAGARVKRGSILAVLEPTLEASLAYAQALSEAHYADEAFAHTQSLFGQRLATRDQLAAAHKSRADAQARLATEQRIGGGKASILRAPSAGVVAAVAVTTGTHVAADTTLLTLVERGGVYVRLGVTPKQAANIKAGMRVSLQSVFNPELKCTSKISEVSSLLNPGSGLVDVLVPLSGKSGSGFLADSAVVGRILLTQEHALAVPRSALLHDETGVYVFIIQDGKAQRVNVRAGIDDGTWVAVQGALKVGERVVTQGNYELSDGMAVRGAAP